MAEGTVSKNKTANTGKYSYKYVDIAQVHEYLESINTRYYQYIDRLEGEDYVMTVPIVEGKELPARRGCKVVDATLVGTTNPAQQQGSAITYARRYSLLMAFGLATDDDDAQSLSKPKASAKKEPEKPKVEPEPAPWDLGPETITPEEAERLEQLIVTVPGKDAPDVRIQKICTYYKVARLDDLTPEQYTKLMKQLGGKA